METTSENPHLRINADGVWCYGETPLERLGLIRLFYSVLRQENDRFYLTTPVEKVPVIVEDVPYSVVGVERVEKGIQCTLNDETTVLFDVNSSPRIGSNHALYINVNDTFEARFTRSTYAQISAWIEKESENVYFLELGGARVYLSQKY
jgi:uncharacterized protein